MRFTQKKNNGLVIKFAEEGFTTTEIAKSDNEY
jgi:hypothetical protein